MVREVKHGTFEAEEFSGHHGGINHEQDISGEGMAVLVGEEDAIDFFCGERLLFFFVLFGEDDEGREVVIDGWIIGSGEVKYLLEEDFHVMGGVIGGAGGSDLAEVRDGKVRDVAMMDGLHAGIGGCIIDLFGGREGREGIALNDGPVISDGEADFFLGCTLELREEGGGFCLGREPAFGAFDALRASIAWG